VPATVQAVLSARIDRLSVEQKRLLQTASVLGKDVPYALLREVVRRDEPAGPAVLAGASASDAEASLQIGLAQLQAAEFLYEASLFPEPEYTFKHALTHEVAYGSLLGERRRALHRQVVAAVERLYSDRLTEHVERLADHAFRAEAWEQAAAYGRQAGAKASSRGAFREAVAAFERALAALSHLPEGRTSGTASTCGPAAPSRSATEARPGDGREGAARGASRGPGRSPWWHRPRPNCSVGTLDRQSGWRPRRRDRRGAGRRAASSAARFPLGLALSRWGDHH
jgi:predicted ATPase